MAKIRDPRTFSDYYGIDPTELASREVLDPTLNVDTRLFIDPFLLAESKHTEISQLATVAYDRHFGDLVKLLVASAAGNDAAYRGAFRMLSFPEVKWTCLGYGSRSVSGSGSGGGLTSRYLRTAEQIIALGVEDPDLFVAMALFEEGVGADRISDMTTNVILEPLLKFNERILGELGVPSKPVKLKLRDGTTSSAELAENPFLGPGEPVILVPSDVLSALPVATNRSAVEAVAAENARLRGTTNRQVSGIWEATTRKSKRELRNQALSSKIAFEALLGGLRGARRAKYDLASDPMGEILWRNVASTIAFKEPRTIESPATWDRAGVERVVREIIDQFRFLVEERRLGKLFYSHEGPKNERAAQRLFFAVAHSYCKANNLDLTPEAETGYGPVDFKVSSGFEQRTLVEIKLSTNSKLVSGFTKQLKAYASAEETPSTFFLVLNVGRLGKKYDKVMEICNKATASREWVHNVVLIDAMPRPSASKL